MENLDFSEGDQKLSVPPERYIDSFSKSQEEIDEKCERGGCEKFLIKYKKILKIRYKDMDLNA